MHQLSAHTVNREASDTPIARIDAQDTPFILPLREYFETHGVKVTVNVDGSGEPIYHVVAGDVDFVSNNFRMAERGVKRMGILVGFTRKHVPEHMGKAVYVFTDPIPLSAADVVEVMDHFFTGGVQPLDLRKHTVIVKQEEYVPGETKLVSHLPAIETQEKNEKVSVDDDRERIKHLMNAVFGDDAKPNAAKIREQKKRQTKLKRQTILAFFVGIGVVILPLFWYLLGLTISSASLVMSAKTLASGNQSGARWQLNVSDYWQRQSEFVLSVFGLPVSALGGEKVIRGQERFLSFLSDARGAEEHVIALMGVGVKVARGLINQVDVTGTGTTSVSDIVELRTSLSAAQNMLGLAQAELGVLLRDRVFPFSFGYSYDAGTTMVDKLSSLRESAANTDEMLSLFLQISGITEAKTYLLLFQNSMELRATGGFIGSVGVASFADGRLTDLQVQDVYTFDGQLKGHVDPPMPVREMLAQEHWYLRDSNWDPDFLESAKRAAWFYEKETGGVVDGVMAINTPFVVELLRATGPIDLPDYNDRISAENFYGKSLYYTQSNFFPGSTQKKDFLGALTRALMEKITTSRDVNMVTLFRAITMSLAKHDIMMMFNNPDLQTLAEHYGWAGRLPSLEGCAGVDPAVCRFDPLAVVESNMGVNKVNYFVDRELSREVSIDPDGSVREAATVILKNNSGKSLGDEATAYRTYVRFLVPADASVSEVTIDGAHVPENPWNKKGNPPPLVVPYMERAEVSSALYGIGVALDVPPGTEKKVSISYQMTAPLVFGPAGTVLELFTQKQPGVGDVPVHVTIHYPFDWAAGFEEQGSIGGVPTDFIAKDSEFGYNTILSRDQITRLRLTKLTN